MKILLIEDNETFSAMLCAALQEAGHEAGAALSGKEGLKKALSFGPDLILLDYNLGDMNGYDVAMNLKYMKATAEIPFLLLSSMADDPLLAGAFGKIRNCRGALVKSLPTEEILSLLSAALL